MGGKVDPHEKNKYKTAALREMCEETEFCENIKLKLLYIFKENRFSYRTYLGFVNEEFEPVLNWENSGREWLGFNEMVNHESLHPGFAEMLADEKSLRILKELVK